MIRRRIVLKASGHITAPKRVAGEYVAEALREALGVSGRKATLEVAYGKVPGWTAVKVSEPHDGVKYVGYIEIEVDGFYAYVCLPAFKQLFGVPLRTGRWISAREVG